MKLQILLSLLLSSSVSFAQTEDATETSNNTKASVSEVQKSDEAQGDIDDEITNVRMRATLGSKSRWSMKASLAYTGGSVQEPLATVIPNYRSGVDKPGLSSFGGNIGANYRMSKGGNLSFGTGVTMLAPLEGNPGESFENPIPGRTGTLERYNVSTPYVDYSHGFKLWGLQQISSATYSHYTSEELTSSAGDNLFGNFSLSHVVLADLGTSNWQAGFSVSVDKDFFRGDYSQALIAQGYNRYDWGVGLYPFAEYMFNDTFSFRTVFGYFQFRKLEQGNDVEQYEPYQSMGIGISLTRDIYLYPNVQFTPKDIRADRTNVSISANLNVF